MPDELDPMGPGELGELFRAWRERMVRDDLRAAKLICAVVGGHPADHFESLQHLRPPLPTAEALAAKLDSVLG